MANRVADRAKAVEVLHLAPLAEGRLAAAAHGDSDGGGDSTNDIETDDDEGLLGGHFDLDTALELAEWEDGDTDAHVHEYDNRHNTLTIDFFDMEGGALDDIDDEIEDGDEAEAGSESDDGDDDGSDDE